MPRERLAALTTGRGDSCSRHVVADGDQGDCVEADDGRRGDILGVKRNGGLEAANRNKHASAISPYSIADCGPLMCFNGTCELMRACRLTSGSANNESVQPVEARTPPPKTPSFSLPGCCRFLSI